MVHENREVNISKQTGSVEISESVAQVAEEIDNKRRRRRRRRQVEVMPLLTCGVLWSGQALTGVSCRVVLCCKGKETEACTASVRQWK